MITSLHQAASRKLREEPARDRNRSTDDISLVHRTVMRMWPGWAMWGEGHVTQEALRIQRKERSAVRGTGSRLARAGPAFPTVP